ncbi:MAG TPA: ATP-binding cassette domain-containing protein, partial [Beutenbergiaceae bacterium]|nr:ATP-binding cassette domain-containing protein [Beutenbergiaceae bacterium]
TVQKSILDLLTDLRRDIGTAILLVTHDLAVAADRASHVVVLSEGKVVESGPTADILTRPQAPYTATLVANAPAFTTRPRSQQNPSYREDPPVITADQLSKTFTSGKTSHRALNAVSFAVSRGTTHALVGESGSGKTTTARAVMGFTRPSAGHVTVDGVDPHALSPKQLRAWRSRVQMVYQNPFSSLNPRHRIGDIIAEPLKNFRIGNAGERSKRVAELLDAVALPSRTADQRPAELSGGMRQRVAIARALAPSPAVVVLDEATSALDVTVQSQILTLLTDLQRDLGVTYLFISHNLAVVRQVSDTVSVMQHGSVVESGAVEEVFTNPTHPYTTALLSAIPGQTAWAAALSPIHI